MLAFPLLQVEIWIDFFQNYGLNQQPSNFFSASSVSRILESISISVSTLSVRLSSFMAQQLVLSTSCSTTRLVNAKTTPFVRKLNVKLIISWGLYKRHRLFFNFVTTPPSCLQFLSVVNFQGILIPDRPSNYRRFLWTASQLVL